ncbi:MAG: hypothetical protein R2809_14160 [Flavobacteriales bacterium]
MKKLSVVLFTVLSCTLFAQTDDCKCFDGIGSASGDAPVLTFEFSNGQSIEVCGFVEEIYDANKILVSEFNVFNCKTGDILVEYGAVQTCLVQKGENELNITEMLYLPTGENWHWEEVKVGLQSITLKSDSLVVSEQISVYDPAKLSSTNVELFIQELRKLKGSGNLENPEEIIGRLEVLALSDYDEAFLILMDFENYFSYLTDGAIREQWTDAIATVEWLKK